MSKRPAVVFHPGVHLKDEMEALGWTVEELAEKMGWYTIGYLKEVLDQKKGITTLLSRYLGNVFGTGAEFWMNLDLAYKDWIWEANE